MAAIIGHGNELGKPVDVNEAADHIFGLVMMNDWGARDIQEWEYVPLLGKSFGTTVSPWIVTLDSLELFACDAPKQVRIKPAGLEQSSVVTSSNFNHLYWTLTQQPAHHTINGCNLRPSDLLGTGTISGPDLESYGCLVELTRNVQKPLLLNGRSRIFLEGGDENIVTGSCKGDGYNVGFWTCSGKIIPSVASIFYCACVVDDLTLHEIKDSLGQCLDYLQP